MNIIMKTKTILLLSIALFLIILLPLPALAAPQGKIDFIRDGDVWIMNADGSGQKRLLSKKIIDKDGYYNFSSIFWSPDGKRFVVKTMQSPDNPANNANPGNFLIATAEGKKIVWGDFIPERGLNIYWSRDSKFIYFPAWQRSGDLLGIYKFDVRSGKSTRLLKIPSYSEISLFAVSPDYRIIAYGIYGESGEANNLFMFNIKNEQKNQLIQANLINQWGDTISDPVWSAGSKKLYIQISPPGSPYGGIYSITIKDHEITKFGKGGRPVKLSPDGKKLLINQKIISNLEGLADYESLKVINLEDMSEASIVNASTANNYFESYYGDWSNDSRYMVFEKNFDVGNYELWIAGADGTNPHKIADNAAEPAWQPRPTSTIPILLIHGYQNAGDVWGGWVKSASKPLYISDKDKFSLYSAEDNYIFKDKYVPFYTLDYGAQNKGHIPDVAKILPKAIEKIKADSGAKKVVIVAHSMGGLLTREYMENLLSTKYRRDIAGFISLDTPHEGAREIHTIEKIKWILPVVGGISGIAGATLLEKYFGPAAQDMKPESEVMSRLNQGKLPAKPEKYGFVVGNYYPFFGDGLVAIEEQIPYMSNNISNLHSLVDYEITFINAVHSGFVKRWGSKWLSGSEESNTQGEAIPIVDHQQTKDYVVKRYNEIIK
ncbi:MAG TPA: alpha/beta hydrolase [Actinobacteria bacterium]|nr:alpha/beta hydrolase [Actinomycetes bacterium]HEX21324.1 alpha/beta hydrolase [Actinomycetota bacterium]